MKNGVLRIVILLISTVVACAAEPSEDQWNRMFKVMYGDQAMTQQAQLAGLKALIAEGADVNMAIGFDRMLRVGETRANLRGTTWPLNVALYHGRVEMVKLLLASGAKFHGGELAQAAFLRDPAEALAVSRMLFGAGADVNSQHENFTPLFWASYRGNTNLVKLLLTQPDLLLDTPSPDGHTALMTAAEHGHLEIVEMLVQAGANVGFKSQSGETAATLAQKTLAKQQAIVDKQQTILSRLQPRPK